MPNEDLVKAIETLRPLLDLSKYEGGYDCCGCSTYDWIFDDILAVVKGQDPASIVAQRR